MIERKASPYDDRIYTAAWRAWQDPEIPERFNPVDHLLARARAAADPANPVLISDGQGYSVDAFETLVARFGAALRAVGAQPGERLLLFGTDSLEYVATWLGAVRVGIIPVVVSDLYKAPDLLYFLEDTGAATLYLDGEQAGKLATIGAQLPRSLRRVVLRGAPEAELDDVRAAADLHPLDALLDSPASDATESPSWEWHANDVCYMFYSGGTTGKAKGITHLAHDFFIVPARQGAYWNYHAGDVVYASSRKYFTHGIWPGVLIPLAHGATVVIDRRGPAPDVIFELIERHRVTKFITVPTILKNMLVEGRESRRRPDLGSLELVISASEKISREVFEDFEAMFGAEILDSIGSSEITYEWIANRPEDSRRGSLGKPVFGYEIRLVDAHGEDVTTPDTPGEAWVKSRTSCFYYWRKFDKSRETFIGPWTRTGDNLMFDEDGFFWFAGRDNDVFKVKGLWVSPIPIEEAVARHDAVLEAAVVSYQDGDGLTKPRCFVVLHNDHADQAGAALEVELAALVKPLGGYMVPAEFHFVGALPRTTLMKIDRKCLRDSPQDYIAV